MHRLKSILLSLVCTAFCLCVFSSNALSQRYLSDLDSSLFIKDTVRPFLKNFANLRFSGYIQAQYQVISADGAKTFGGGDFAEFSKSRFMLRRGRLRMDYLSVTEHKLPRALFVFQVDATERNVRVRDMFIRVYETKKNNFSLTTGIFGRPFGYEVNLASVYRETPERGRMSQILMPSERDLGVMVSYEPQRREAHNHIIKVDAGIFNGPGLSSVNEFDNKKDFISRITLKPIRKNKIEISGGLSFLYGGWRQVSKYVYEVGKSPAGNETFIVDSSLSNIGKTAPRQYYGADVQLKWLHDWGNSELRAEFWTGKQSGTSNTTVNPGTLPIVPTFIRKFDGAFFYFLQNIVNSKNQLLVKYDWYDPDTRIAGNEIGKAGANFTDADIKFSTWGFGFAREITNTVKVVLYYEIVKNETTLLTGYTTDVKDNLFTCRLQFRF